MAPTQPTQPTSDRRSTQTSSSISTSISKQVEQPIIWALDPTERDVTRLRPLSKAIETWQHYFPGAILPVAVVSPSELNWPVEFVASIKEKLVLVANEHLKPAVRETFGEKDLDPHILLHSGISHREAADELLSYAKKHKAQIIAVNTHGRRGIDRIRLGSFAELLLSQDEIPILALNLVAAPHAEIRKIAFPTDFSESSKLAFQNAIELARKLSAKLTLIHVYTTPNQFFFDGEFGYGVTSTTIQQAWKEAEDTQRREGEQWTQIAIESGIDAEIIFNTDMGRTGEIVTKVARDQNADLIYLSTSYGKIGQTFLGGTVRDVLATSSVAVFVKRFKDFRKRGLSS